MRAQSPPAIILNPNVVKTSPCFLRLSLQAGAEDDVVQLQGRRCLRVPATTLFPPPLDMIKFGSVGELTSKRCLETVHEVIRAWAKIRPALSYVQFRGQEPSGFRSADPSRRRARISRRRITARVFGLTTKSGAQRMERGHLRRRVLRLQGTPHPSELPCKSIVCCIRTVTRLHLSTALKETEGRRL